MQGGLRRNGKKCFSVLSTDPGRDGLKDTGGFLISFRYPLRERTVSGTSEHFIPSIKLDDQSHLVWHIIQAITFLYHKCIC